MPARTSRRLDSAGGAGSHSSHSILRSLPYGAGSRKRPAAAAVGSCQNEESFLRCRWHIFITERRHSIKDSETG